MTNLKEKQSKTLLKAKYHHFISQSVRIPEDSAQLSHQLKAIESSSVGTV